jgi:putative flippase GtrA
VTGPVNVLERLRAPGLIRRLFHELLRFGSVGAIGFVIDVGLFNLLSYGPWAPLAGQPLAAKVASVSVSTLFAWLGNRHWTFKHRRGRAAHHELLLFVLFSVGGLLIALGCLWLSHYVLGFKSPLADNISANVIGLGLASAFRFVTYRTFVFHRPAHAVADTAAHV